MGRWGDGEMGGKIFTVLLSPKGMGSDWKTQTGFTFLADFLDIYQKVWLKSSRSEPVAVSTSSSRFDCCVAWARSVAQLRSKT